MPENPPSRNQFAFTGLCQPCHNIKCKHSTRAPLAMASLFPPTTSFASRKGRPRYRRYCRRLRAVQSFGGMSSARMLPSHRPLGKIDPPDPHDSALAARLFNSEARRCARICSGVSSTIMGGGTGSGGGGGGEAFGGLIGGTGSTGAFTAAGSAACFCRFALIAASCAVAMARALSSTITPLGDPSKLIRSLWHSTALQ